MCFRIKILSPFPLGTIWIPIQNQKCPKNACADMTMVPSWSIRQIHYSCRKIIKYGISVSKISTHSLPGQTLEEITYIFDQLNAWKIPQKYCKNKRKHYRSRVLWTWNVSLNTDPLGSIVMFANAFLAVLGHLMGICIVPRWNGLKILIPKHMWKS